MVEIVAGEKKKEERKAPKPQIARYQAKAPLPPKEKRNASYKKSRKECGGS